MTVDNLIDTQTGTVKLRAQFLNSNGMLFPNQFVNTRLLVNTLDNQIMVPSSAIQHNGDVAFVYLIKPGPGNPNAASQGSSSQTGAASPNGGTNQGGGSGKGSGKSGKSGQSGGKQGGGSGQGNGQGQGKAQYHVVMQVVKTGVTDNGWTAITGIASGTVVANSSFDKLMDQADIAISNVGIPDAQTTISGESSAP
jgi:multidrug efflux system membrane fusion protein